MGEVVSLAKARFKSEVSAAHTCSADPVEIELRDEWYCALPNGAILFTAEGEDYYRKLFTRYGFNWTLHSDTVLNFMSTFQLILTMESERAREEVAALLRDPTPLTVKEKALLEALRDDNIESLIKLAETAEHDIPAPMRLTATVDAPLSNVVPFTKPGAEASTPGKRTKPVKKSRSTNR